MKQTNTIQDNIENFSTYKQDIVDYQCDLKRLAKEVKSDIKILAADLQNSELIVYGEYNK